MCQLIILMVLIPFAKSAPLADDYPQYLIMSFTVTEEYDAETAARLYKELFGDAKPGEYAQLPYLIVEVPDENPFYRAAGTVGQMRTFLNSLSKKERDLMLRVRGVLGDPQNTYNYNGNYGGREMYSKQQPVYYIAVSAASDGFTYSRWFWESQEIREGQLWTESEYRDEKYIMAHYGHARVQKINIGDTVDVFGVPHKVIGWFHDGLTRNTSHVSLYSLPDDTPLCYLDIRFATVPTQVEYNSIYDKFDTSFEFSKIPVPNTDSGVAYGASYDVTFELLDTAHNPSTSAAGSVFPALVTFVLATAAAGVLIILPPPVKGSICRENFTTRSTNRKIF
jgi:hypothetical protein